VATVDIQERLEKIKIDISLGTRELANSCKLLKKYEEELEQHEAIVKLARENIQEMFKAQINSLKNYQDAKDTLGMHSEHVLDLRKKVDGQKRNKEALEEQVEKLEKQAKALESKLSPEGKLLNLEFKRDGE